jgi:5-methylcytosine-specific restriction endonuclease McrBC regulatory subunit McrC
MLFEYFVRKQFKRAGYVLNSKFENRAEIPTGGYGYKRKLEPDVVFIHKEKQFIFDVKYKNFDFIYGTNREDLFQLHTYVGQYGNEVATKACGFIYPISSSRWNSSSLEKDKPFIQSKIKILGFEIDFYILFIIVPNDKSENYRSEFANNTELFLKTINSITN